MRTRKKEIVILEDGDEYAAFADMFLSDQCRIRSYKSVSEALTGLAEKSADYLLLDLRFDRSPEADLTGDIEKTARRLFAGDREAAVQYLRENQGTFALAVLRRAGYYAKALFVHDFPKGRLENLRRLYGDVQAVPSFDVAGIRAIFGLDE